jgi:hypothetical protein
MRLLSAAGRSSDYGRRVPDSTLPAPRRRSSKWHFGIWLMLALVNAGTALALILLRAHGRGWPLLLAGVLATAETLLLIRHAEGSSRLQRSSHVVFSLVSVALLTILVAYVGFAVIYLVFQHNCQAKHVWCD